MKLNLGLFDTTTGNFHTIQMGEGFYNSYKNNPEDFEASSEDLIEGVESYLKEGNYVRAVFLSTLIYLKKSSIDTFGKESNTALFIFVDDTKNKGIMGGPSKFHGKFKDACTHMSDFVKEWNEEFPNIWEAQAY